MGIQQTVELWQQKATDSAIKEQLEDLLASGDEKAVEDAFFRELEFGTGGLRGIIGPGCNRMNIYTVGKATQGLANYLHSLPGTEKSVAIARDSRINGELFMKVAAGVLAANGIKAYLYERIEPTPALSWATRTLGCDAGICVTASHNPSAYNGYKAYGSDGCQVTSQMAADIQAAIDRVDAFEDVHLLDFDEALVQGLVAYTDESVLDSFIEAVYAQSLEPATSERAANAPALRVVYTPLNGTGLESVTRILDRIGVDDVHVVPEQAVPDGNFSTCPFPNPEIREALQKGIELCEKVHPDLLLATDPDADRVGIAVQDGGEYVLLTGNEVGVLLFDYVCRMRSEQGIMPKDPIAVSTIVSTDMCDAVAAKYGVELARTLTGFKYIGELITGLESKGQEKRFIFGYEESYGYLSGPHVRDKDAVNASMLICQMARYYKGLGKNLVQAMKDLYEEFGYYQNSLLNVVFEGADGARAMQNLMASLRKEPPVKIAGLPVVGVKDYAPGIEGLPPANVLQFDLEGDQKVLVRPSGTEPKIKAYLFANSSSMKAAKALCSELKDAAAKLLAV